MQSGKKAQRWLMEYVCTEPQYVEPVMHWIGRDSTERQVSMYFDSRESAAAFAVKNGWDYRVETPHERKFVPKSYADNFRSTIMQKSSIK